MLVHALESLGFNPDEVKIYLFLLESGPSTVRELTKKAGAVRSSLYGFLKRLQDRGLIVQSLKQGIKTFAAEAPDKINFLFEQRLEGLQKQQLIYQKLLPELRHRQPSHLIIPKLQLFEGKEGLQNMIRDVFLYRDLDTQSFWPIKDMLDILSPEFFNYMNKQRIKNNIAIRALWPESQVVNIKDHPYLGVGEAFKRAIRVTKFPHPFSMGYWSYGNKVAFISSRKESFGFIIESRELVDMLLSQFDLIWELSKPVSYHPEDGAPFLKELVSDR